MSFAPPFAPFAPVELTPSPSQPYERRSHSCSVFALHSRRLRQAAFERVLVKPRRRRRISRSTLAGESAKTEKSSRGSELIPRLSQGRLQHVPLAHECRATEGPRYDRFEQVRRKADPHRPLVCSSRPLDAQGHLGQVARDQGGGTSAGRPRWSRRSQATDRADDGAPSARERRGQEAQARG